MFVQTETTPNPNALKFIPGKAVSNNGSFEFTKKEESNNELVRNLLSINGVTGIFLGSDFLSVNKEENKNWEDIKHIVISLINEHYLEGKEFILDKNYTEEGKPDLAEIDSKSEPRQEVIENKMYSKMEDAELVLRFFAYRQIEI